MKPMPRAALAVPVVLLVALLASCGIGGSSSNAKSEDASGGATSRGESSLADPDASGSDGTSDSRSDSASGATAPGTKQAAATEPLTRAVISTGQISLHSKSINKARAELMRLVTSWNGVIADEQSNSDNHGRMVDSTFTLRVPTATFSRAMNDLAGLGKVDQQSRKSEDVTTKVIDNAARVRAAERSIRQIELLLGRAKELRDIITIESDLARRQADLDSLKSQQAWLEDQTSLSTITVYLSQPAGASPPQDEARGFLAGLDDGWDALKASTVVLLTVVGAVLPFAVLVALFGVPLWVVVRRRLGAARLSAGSAPAQSA
jgi:hypothetical protein